MSILPIQKIIYNISTEIISDEGFLKLLKEVDTSYEWTNYATIRISKKDINLDIIKKWEILASLNHRKIIVEILDDKVYISFKSLLEEDISTFVKTYNKGVIYCRYNGEEVEDYINTEHNKLEISFHPDLLQTKEGKLYTIDLNANKTYLYNPLFFYTWHKGLMYTKDKLLTKTIFEKWNIYHHIELDQVSTLQYQNDCMKYL